ncbi:MAG: hypothetical protein ABIK89_13265 [Planctomycetota bacterium]
MARAGRITGQSLTDHPSPGENRSGPQNSPLLEPPMDPGIALLLTLMIVCPASPVQAAEPQQDLQAKSEDPTGALDSPDVKQRIQQLRQLAREPPASLELPLVKPHLHL